MKTTLIIPVLFSIFLFIPSKLISADNSFRRLSIDNGLIWIGTLSGLQCYDGYTLQTYDYYPREQKVVESHNRIWDMVQYDNLIWIATDTGLTLFDLDKLQYISYVANESKLQDSLSRPIESLFLDKENGYLWIKTKSEMIVTHLKENQITPIDWIEDDQYLKNNIKEIVCYNNYSWATDGLHLFQIDNIDGVLAVKNEYSTDLLLKPLDFFQSLNIHDNNLFIRSSQGCYKFNLLDDKLRVAQYLEFNQIDPRIPKVTDGKIKVSDNGSLWCTYLEGVFEVIKPFEANTSIKEYLRNTYDTGQSSKKVKDIIIDSYDNLWIATHSLGVFYKTLSDSFFKSLSSLNFQKLGFWQNEIVSITESNPGSYWLVVEHGSLFRYSSETGALEYVDLPIIDSFKQSYYQWVEASTDRTHLYIGTSKGVLIYNLIDKKLRVLTPLSLEGESFTPSVCYLKEDKGGKLWVGTWGNGIYCIDNPLSSPQVILALNTNSKPSLSSNNTTQILVINENVYITTPNGLNKLKLTEDYQLEHLTLYQVRADDEKSLSSNYLASIDCENDSTFWVGTIGGGLNRVVLHSNINNDYSAETFRVVDGLQSNDVEIVLVDDSLNVWVGGHGISRVNHSDHSILTYGMSSGVQNNSYKVNVSLKSASGLFFMGGLNGLNYFEPNNFYFSDELCSYDLVLRSLSVNNEVIEPGKSYKGRQILDCILDKTTGITLNHLQNNFSISFAALGYQLSDQILFRYRLLGLNSEWDELKYTNNEVKFLDLPYNTYNLELQLSCDKGQTWIDGVKKLKIEILPPWWLSKWSILGYTLLVLALTYYFLRLYMRRQNLEKENEIQKALIQQDQERYQSKMLFFMNVSHELKTPLTLIHLMAEKLSKSKHLDGEPSIILDNTQKMKSLISELIDIHKAELGVSDIHLTSLNFALLVEQVFRQISSWAEDKQIEISFCQNCDEVLISGDRKKLEKMVVNLFSNAIKYTNCGGKINIKLEIGTLSDITPSYGELYSKGASSKSEQVAILIVRDTGIGISEESIRLIYERFFQMKGAQNNHLGSGIGLAIVKSVVLQHNGNISVSSKRSVGTEFIITLPLLNKKEASILDQNQNNDFYLNQFVDEEYCELEPKLTKIENRSDSVQEESNCDKPSILIVEDHKLLQQTLKEWLSNKYTIYTADNGREGLEKCLSVFPDLIISDVMMPEMNGIELCREVRNNLSIASIPIILLTAKESIQSQLDGYESGADLYIAKPFSMAILSVNIERLLKQRELWYRRDLKDNPQDTPPKIDETIEGDTNSIIKPSERELLEKAELEAMLNKLKRIIESELSDPNLSPDTLAEAMAMSRAKLYRDLKQISDETLSDYVRNVRLEKAAELLRTTTMTVQEIMESVGFINGSHFTKIFKFKYSVPPTEYRKKH